MGQYYEQAGQRERALEQNQKGLEAEDLSEEFHQRLMGCYLMLDRRGEALEVYHRCKETLSAVLGIVPSPNTDNIYTKIKTG